MILKIRKILNLFDEKPEDANGHITGIVGMIGEELNAELFKHYLVNEHKSQVEILSDRIGPGTKKGNRLDRWVLADSVTEQVAYQCEIKNWSSWAIGGRKINSSDDEDKIFAVAKYNWDRALKSYLAPQSTPSGVLKVLLKMKYPPSIENREVRPCVIFWMPFARTRSDGPFFKIPVAELNVKFDTPFNKKKDYLYFFSASLYLRILLARGVEQINIEMPFLEARNNFISKCFSRNKV